ncbi:glycosyl hydrolase [Patescibacteria group bacterium]|nr:glycosyl hydrolase [Patescibacteria group bacterium]MBU4601127.1 glycosyl hydrolase [Patescibacteria group bacterium]MCG2698447.1 MvaI/BcnI family restriction endonuclease [Candidatus Parcubacteria bacterium]
MTLQQLKTKLKEIKKMGFVKTHRAHDTGIGKTLEDLLKIKENNLRLPDVGDIELKAKRINSGSMLTIATKSPKPKGINKILFEKYKYLDKEGKYNLHSTVCGSRKNPQSFKIVFEGEKLILKNKSKIEAYWPISIFDNVLKAKSDKILLVFAEIKGERKTKKEKFHFTEAYLLSNLNINKFKSAVESDKLKIDIRIGVYRSGENKGKYHDHGTGFRINKRDFLHLFDNFAQII